MEQNKLPPRLEAIARLVPEGCRLADVGTDHGLLPVRLLENGVIQSAVASDLRPGPLSAAKNNARIAGVENIRFCLCDGLDGISSDEADAVVIAGMGGETIAGILERTPWVRRDKTLILQPMTKPEILRKALEGMDLRIERERLVSDSGRIYSVMLARSGKQGRYSEIEYYTGRFELISRERLFSPFLDMFENKLAKALEGMKKAETERSSEREEELLVLLEQLREKRKEYDESI